MVDVMCFLQFAVADDICSHLLTVLPPNYDFMNCAFFGYSYSVICYPLYCYRCEHLLDIPCESWVAKKMYARLSVEEEECVLVSRYIGQEDALGVLPRIMWVKLR